MRKLLKRWIKWWAIRVGALLLLIFLLLSFEHFRGTLALRWRLHKLAARGEVVSLAQLIPPRPPADQNAFLGLLALTNRIDSLLTNFNEAPPSSRFATPGRVVVSSQLEQWQRENNQSGDWLRLGASVGSADEVLADLAATFQRPAFDSGFDYQKGLADFQIGPLAKAKQAALVLQAATLYELKRGNLDRAHTNLLTLVKLAGAQRPEPLIICQLVRQACAALAFTTTWQALQAPGWSEPQLAALQSAWEEPDYPHDLLAALVMERALTLDLFQQVGQADVICEKVLSQSQPPAELTGGILDLFPVHGFFENRFARLIWRFTWLAHDELKALNQGQLLLEQARSALTNSGAPLLTAATTKAANSPGLLPLGESKAGWFDRMRFPLSGQIFTGTDLLVQKALHAEVQQKLCISAIAAQRFRLQAGTFPPDLASLVPRQLPALPRDSMDGKILRYRPDPVSGFLLYSVGDDGVDNGGDPALADNKTSYRQIFDGRDAVWPVPATPEQVAAAAKGTEDVPSVPRRK